MSRALLDINVLLALLDSDHLDHQRARAWVEAEITHGWASCAITQNGFVRIISQPGYPNPITPSQAMGLLSHATDTEYHHFWASSVSVLDEDLVDRDRVHGHRQVTDVYLLALAAANGGRFVTFDQRISIEAVRGASDANLTVI